MTTEQRVRGLRRRLEATRLKVENLTSLRRLVNLPTQHELSERQWGVIDSQLVVMKSRLLARLKQAGREHLPKIFEASAAQMLNSDLGEVELDLSKAFTFFDTYMDVLTQRSSPQLGPLLVGCDVLAWDAFNGKHPALAIIEPPLVYCDRGFGASIVREGVPMPDHIPNPIPLIQIPYSRLKEKYNLTSIIHEAGHEAVVRLGLVSSIPKALRSALSNAGAPSAITELFTLWSSEIGPDFWTFCACGPAAAAGIKEILALAPHRVLSFSWADPHPPPYLRVLLSFEWCRQVWGQGDWDEWEKDWLEFYPLSKAPGGMRKFIKSAVEYLPNVSRVLLRTRFRVLNGRTIPDLFKLSDSWPKDVKTVAASAQAGRLRLAGLSPCAQLAVFRAIRDQGALSEETIDKVMTKWLISLGQTRGGQYAEGYQKKEVY